MSALAPTPVFGIEVPHKTVEIDLGLLAEAEHLLTELQRRGHRPATCSLENYVVELLSRPPPLREV